MELWHPITVQTIFLDINLTFSDQFLAEIWLVWKFRGNTNITRALKSQIYAVGKPKTVNHQPTVQDDLKSLQKLKKIKRKVNIVAISSTKWRQKAEMENSKISHSKNTKARNS